MTRAAAVLFARPRLTATVLGGLSACGFAPLGLWPLTLLCLALLTALLARAESRRQAFLLGWLFGLSQFSVGLNWIVTAFGFQAALPPWLGWIAVIVLSAYLAVWPGLALLGAWLLGRGNRPALVLALAGCWAIGEWLRGWVLTGFPWNPLGAITLRSYADPGLAFTAQWLGTYALSGLVMLLAGGWWLALERRRADMPGAALVLAPVLLMLVPAPRDTREGTLDFTLVQPNTAQEELHDPARYEETFQRSMNLSRALRPGQTRLVLWPESGLPDFLFPGYPAHWYRATTYGADPQLARWRIGRMIGDGAVLLTGNDRLDVQDGKVTSARAGISAIASYGTVRATYDKAHLVPFGEYVPLPQVLEPLGLARFVPGDIGFKPGPGPRTIALGAWGRVGMQLCYEIIFPGAVTQPGVRPDFIFNPSNDGWYGDWGPPQHLAHARLRAIEEGLPVLRSTTTGVSAVIDARGRVRHHVPLRRAARIDGKVPPAADPTLFALAGNALSLGWAIALLALSVVARRRRGR
ncbi:MAG: apolipoprotein N-acyltransferase [Novosphingobium sp.]